MVAALDLRKRRPEAFAGAYEPVEAGEGAIAYLRGGDGFVAAEIFPGGKPIAPPPGEWRDVLTDRGIAVLERY